MKNSIFRLVLGTCLWVVLATFAKAQCACIPVTFRILKAGSTPSPPAPQSYKQVLFVGNSITTHAPAPAIGWNGNWGMAASAADKDYVSVLMSNLKTRNATVTHRIFGASHFEQNYNTFDFNSIKNDTDLMAYLANTDLIIIRLGENINDANVNSLNLALYYKKLIDELKVNPNAKIVLTTSFWPAPNTNSIIAHAATHNSYMLADIAPLWNDPTNTALGAFTNASVAKHPSDKGMKAIADLIWEQVK